MSNKVFCSLFPLLFVLLIGVVVLSCRDRLHVKPGHQRMDAATQPASAPNSVRESDPEQSCNSEPDSDGRIDMSSRELESMTKRGAVGAVSVRVFDELGSPVPDAKVNLYFTQPELDDPLGRVNGMTDSSGCFSAEGKSNWACNWIVSKEGFHSSRGKVLFTHRGSQEAVRRGRWTLRPIEVHVELKSLSNAHLVHGVRYLNLLYYPTNSWTGFDFSVCDWVEPIGKGQTSYVSFLSESWGVSPFLKGGTPGYTNKLSIRVENGGLSVLRESGDSDSPFVAETPPTLQTNQLAFILARTRDAILENTRLDDDEYIVFRTMTSTDDGNVSHCGIIRSLEFSPGELRLEYFFNPENGDNRIDGDVRSAKNLGK